MYVKWSLRHPPLHLNPSTTEAQSSLADFTHHQHMLDTAQLDTAGVDTAQLQLAQAASANARTRLNSLTLILTDFDLEFAKVSDLIVRSRDSLSLEEYLVLFNRLDNTYARYRLGKDGSNLEIQTSLDNLRSDALKLIP